MAYLEIVAEKGLNRTHITIMQEIWADTLSPDCEHKNTTLEDGKTNKLKVAGTIELQLLPYNYLFPGKIYAKRIRQTGFPRAGC